MLQTPQITAHNISTSHSFFDRHHSSREVIEATLKGKLYTVHQVHKADVVTAPFAQQPQADALITNQPNIILGIRTADCVPVLLHDKANNVIAAIHAGWRSAFQGIIENTIQKMQQLGSSINSTAAAIGPSIQQHSYEVDLNFRQQFLEQDSNHQQFFIANQDQKYLFDLPVYVQLQLQQCGISNIHDTQQDTYTQPELFYSYRYGQHNGIEETGRLISAITLL